LDQVKDLPIFGAASKLPILMGLQAPHPLSLTCGQNEILHFRNILNK
jgi:hypothetical protein